jgi:hypothetical protein
MRLFRSALLALVACGCTATEATKRYTADEARALMK